MNAFKFVIKYFYAGSILEKMEGFAKTAWPFQNAQLLVRIYYFFLLYSSVNFFASWDLSIGPQTGISFIWPISWLQYVNFSTGMIIVRLSFIIASLVVSLAPQVRLFRILSFVTLLEFVSLYYSVLQLDVDWYTMLLASFVLIFLPDKWGNPQLLSAMARQKFLLVFWGSQAIVALTYSMAGIGKLVGAINQFLSGSSNILEPKAAALQVADRLVVTGSTSLLGSWAVEHYLMLWPLFVGTVYLMLFFFVAVFRPNLHKIWGLGLILFHISNYLFINIGFSAHIFLVSLIFLASPFAPPTTAWWDILNDLPIVGFILRSFKHKYG